MEYHDTYPMLCKGDTLSLGMDVGFKTGIFQVLSLSSLDRKIFQLSLSSHCSKNRCKNTADLLIQ